MTSDDGSRVWIDNNLIIDNWYGHAPLAQSKTLELSAGYHLIKVEYFQHVGGMTAQLAIASPDDADKWQGEYFDNPNLEGSPVVRISSSDLNFNWGAGAPDAALPTDHFSARWTRLMNFAPGSYRFTATADDGIRVWVGDTLLINQWHDEQPTTYAADIYLNGNYPVRVEVL